MYQLSFPFERMFLCSVRYEDGSKDVIETEASTYIKARQNIIDYVPNVRTCLVRVQP